MCEMFSNRGSHLSNVMWELSFVFRLQTFNRHPEVASLVFHTSGAYKFENHPPGLQSPSIFKIVEFVSVLLCRIRANDGTGKRRTSLFQFHTCESANFSCQIYPTCCLYCSHTIAVKILQYVESKLTSDCVNLRVNHTVWNWFARMPSRAQSHHSNLKLCEQVETSTRVLCRHWTFDSWK